MLIEQTHKEQWTERSKLIFRFTFSYVILYIVLMFTSGLLEAPFRWIGTSILGFNYEFDVSGYGSGDNTYAYITLFVNFILAVLLTLIWSFFQRHKKEYNKAFYWLIVILRIFIFAAMLLYGFVKVFQIQFGSPSFVRLLQPLGEFSPMGLAWTYMGYSKGFGMFAGIMEILGGVLLVYRRTSTLGAFVVIGVMTQVAMMNLMFDIPVKLFSIHLVFMALIIFMTDIKRFIAVLIKNKAASRTEFYHPNTSKDYHRIMGNIKKVLVPMILLAGCILGYLGELNVSDKNHRPHLYGIWETELFVKNNDTILPLITESQRWRYLMIERKGSAVIKTMNDELTGYRFDIDTTTQRITMYTDRSSTDSLNIKFTYTNLSYLELEGVLEKDSIRVKLSKKDLDSIPLISRKFHWINERPYNR